MTTQRINLNMQKKYLSVIDAFAKMNGRSRTYVIEELLAPSIPALEELLVLADDLEGMTDAERLRVLKNLNAIEEKLTPAIESMPKHIKGAKQ